MSGFTANWLALRHAADLRARNRDVAAALGEAFAGRTGLHVLDIGAGTGANLHATAPLLPRPQHWLLADLDRTLLEQATAPEGITIETRVADLAVGIAPLLNPAPDLVTASAFFDLAGAAWIDTFVAGLAASGAALFAVLSYDGAEDWGDPHPLDDRVRGAFLAHQQGDKGLGPALGPHAHAYLAQRLASAGYRVTEGSSPWRLSAPQDSALIAELARGIARAMGPWAESWGEARARARRVTIGHRDLLAVPNRDAV